MDSKLTSVKRTLMSGIQYDFEKAYCFLDEMILEWK